MAKRGRPRALDDAKRREVCALVAAGASRAQAAKYVGCSEMTLRREAQRDKLFAERIGQAQAAASLAPLRAMRQAAQTHWRAAAWMLERADPEQFGRPHRQHLGAKELRALRRDLIDIFHDEIDHPLARERVAKRVKAAIDYAMRHAWDGRRTGRELRSAMEFFDRRDAATSTASAVDDLLDFPGLGLDPPPLAPPDKQEVSDRSASRGAEPHHDHATIDPDGEKSCAKVGEFCAERDAETPAFPTSEEDPTAQNS